MRTLVGIGLSNLYMLILIGLSSYFKERNFMDREGTRKFVHILAVNWWLIAMVFFDSTVTAAIMPVLFILVNAYSYKKQIFTSIERGEGAKDLGTVYYSLSLLILAVWTFGIRRPELATIGVFIMGYADGLAALVGRKYGKTPLVHGKSLEGTLTHVFVALVVVLVFNVYYGFGLGALGIALIVAAATVMELFTPMGLDNLAVPIGCTGLVYLMV